MPGARRADRRLPCRHRGHQRRDAVRRQRQHGRPPAECARGRDARPELDGRRRATRRRSSPSTRTWTSASPFTTGLRVVAGRAHQVWCRSARRRCTTRLRLTRASRRRARGAPPRGRRDDRRRRQRQPSEAVEDVSAIASAIDVPVYIFGIVPSIDNPSAEIVDTLGRAHRVRRSARRSRRLDRRSRVRGEHAGAAQRRGAANHRRAAASVPHRVRIERQAGLASARGPRAQQGPDRSRPEWIYRGAITPDCCIRRIAPCSVNFSSLFRSP